MNMTCISASNIKGSGPASTCPQDEGSNLSRIVSGSETLFIVSPHYAPIPAKLGVIIESITNALSDPIKMKLCDFDEEHKSGMIVPADVVLGG